MIRTVGCTVFAALLVGGLTMQAASLPAVRQIGQARQLVVNGKPFLILGGELGNSSAGTAEQADKVLPKLAAMHLNTVLMPVAWEQIEPAEGTFDFAILDHWVEVARTQHLHLVLLWFGSWKNGFSSYAPVWVKRDTNRFPRSQSADGQPLEILSTLGAQTQKADGRAFAALMKHVRETDSAQQTVLMVQVENELGTWGQDETGRRLQMNFFVRPSRSNFCAAYKQSVTTFRLSFAPTLNSPAKPGHRCSEMPQMKFSWLGIMRNTFRLWQSRGRKSTRCRCI